MNDTSSTQFAKESHARFPSRSCFRFAVIAFASSIALASCSKTAVPDDKASTAGSVTNPSAAVDLPKVEVPAEGKKFDPPVKAEQLPAGTWYCDMGTVHWAQMQESNHQCPLCKMDLKRKN